MVNSVKTFLKQVGKDYQNQSVNPPVVRASTIIFKTLQDIKKTQSNYKKNPLSKNFDYGRKGTSTTFALQELLRKIENVLNTCLEPAGPKISLGRRRSFALNTQPKKKIATKSIGLLSTSYMNMEALPEC